MQPMYNCTVKFHSYILIIFLFIGYLAWERHFAYNNELEQNKALKRKYL